MALGINFVIALLILGMWYALISEGLWGAALMFFNILFSALIAFNFYEPLAGLLAENVAPTAGYADTTCLIGLFVISLVVLRLTTESIAPAMVRFPVPVFHAGRIVFALGGSLITMAVLILAFETSPVDKKIFGVIDYKFKPPFGMALDRQWLAFFQYTTGYVFADNSTETVDREFGHAKVFDPRGDWLIQHQNARPYGEAVVPEREGGSAPAAASSSGAGSGGGGGGAAPGQPQQSQGTPYGQGGGQSTSSGQGGSGSGTTIGGTAGAAVGVSPN
jgi:hypothetical protein